MTQIAKWKTIGYAVAIFVAGGVSGGALGVYEARAHLFAPPREQDMAFRLRNRLQTRLGLSPDQMAKIGPIIDKAAADLRSIRVETADRVNKVFDDSYTQISALLTPEQQTKLDEMQRERREMMRRHWRSGPGGPAMPGHDDPGHDGVPGPTPSTP